MKRKYKILTTLVAVASLALSGCSQKQHSADFKKQANMSEAYTSSNSSKAPKKASNGLIDQSGLNTSTYKKLAQTDFKNGQKSYIYVNNDQSTLNPNSWKINKVDYQDLDYLNRTSHSNTAFLEKRNLANGSLRVRQYVAHTGWHYNHRKQIYNRGHLIAYSISAGINQNGNYSPNDKSGDQNNPKNLFTQSAYTNQKIQTIFESKIRSALAANKKVIYQATPIFRGNELMARGINLQAISTDKSLNFNVYIFNVQPGYIFNYSNGNSTADSSFIVDNLNNYDSSSWRKNSISNYKYHLKSANRDSSYYRKDYRYYTRKYK